MRSLAVAVLLAGPIPVAHANPDAPADEALATYVAAPDGAYDWRVQSRHLLGSVEIIELRLHSQTWRGTLWKHQLYLIKPAAAAATHQGLFVIGGGRWRDHYDTAPAAELPDGAQLFVRMAEHLGTIVAVLGQVPFQPLFGMTEDELIGHTFEQYLATGDAEWPLLLPMVKSVVRGMDAAQAFAAEQWNASLERFTVIGGSKRGWTTWLTGAVEPRAVALVPIVIDALNFAAHMPYQSTVWGAPSAKLAPYTRRNLHEVLGDERGEKLRRIVDPFSYRDRLAQPKVVVVATNDAYFPLDSMNLYWDALPEPKYALYLPNEEHGVEDYRRVIATLGALHRHSAERAPLPALDWEFEPRDGALRLCVRSAPTPAVVSAWTAESTDAGFAEAQFVNVPTTLENGVHIYDLEWPEVGYRAVFAEALFDDGPNRPFTLSTNIRIADTRGEPPNEATAIVGTSGVCRPPALAESRDAVSR